MKYIVLFIVLSGCGHSINTVSSVTTVARYNQILAYKEYMNEEIVIRGMVVRVGVDSDVSNSVAKVLGNEDTSIFIFKEDDKERDKVFPYVVLGDKVDSKDVAVCFFKFEKSDDATGFVSGSLTSLSGVVKRLVEMDNRIVVIMDGCSVEDK